MATALTFLVDTIFDDEFWIEGNATWNDLEARRAEGVHIAMPRDLLASFPIALVLFVLRLVWEKSVALPLGRYYGLSSSQPRSAVHNAILESSFKRYGKHPPSEEIVVGIAKQADWSVRHVQRWWRRRRLQDKPSTMQKFTETSWRFMFYLVAFWYGVAILWDKDFLWDTAHAWDNYPYQAVFPEIYWYYMVELGFYWSLIMSLFMDHKRKDFVEMIVHHIATIALMSFSWTSGTCRYGALVLLCHDCCDYWMEAAKMNNYIRKQWLCDTCFVVFTILWFITRICIYPYKFLYVSYYESWALIGHTTNMWVVFYGLLFVLQILHVIWFTMIVRMVYRYVIAGNVEKDDRSETEPDTNSDDDKVMSPAKPDNGSATGTNKNNNEQL